MTRRRPPQQHRRYREAKAARQGCVLGTRISRYASLEDRLWPRVDRRGPNECWPWTGHRNRDGYGMLSRGGGLTDRSHRVAWELANGPVPKGAVIRHSCDNPPCCNPAHLLTGTQHDNVRDMVERGRLNVTPPRRWNRGSAHHNAKLDEATVALIRSSNETGENLARRLGVSESLISAVRRREAWRHVA